MVNGLGGVKVEKWVVRELIRTGLRMVSGLDGMRMNRRKKKQLSRREKKMDY